MLFRILATLILALLVAGCISVASPAVYAQNGCVTQDPDAVCLDTDTQLKDPNYAYGRLGPLISLLITLALIGGAIATFVYFIIGAIQWGTAQGGDGAAKGRATMIYATAGMIMLALIYVFLIFYNNLLPKG